MRMVILIALGLLAGYGLLQINQLYPDNYVKVYLAGYVIEVSLIALLALLLIASVVLYTLVRVVWFVLRSGRIWSKWRGQRNHDKAEVKLGEGYLSLIKGDWKKAETLLTTKAQYLAVPYVNYLAAAQAAQEQGNMAQRDRYLEQAYEAAPKERLAIGMTKAKLHQSAGQFEQALSTLQDVESLGRKNPQFTAMLLQSHQQLENWPETKTLLPTAKKQHALPAEVLEDLQSQIDQYELKTADNVSEAWKALPRAQKKKLYNVEVYVDYLLEKKQFAEAEKLIRGSLKHDWSDALVHSYGLLETNKPAKLLRNVEGWLLARPENAELLLAAGRLAKADQQTGVAEAYLQKAIAQGQLAEAFALLGSLYEANNESGKALDLYRAGMKQLTEPGQAQSNDVMLLADAEQTDLPEESDVQEGELVESKAAS